jgi:hypothetical protein
MELQQGERVVFEVTGTVITEEEFFNRLAKLPKESDLGERVQAYLLLDNGVITKIDVSDDEFGMDIRRAKPLYWPVLAGDVWTDDSGDAWYAGNVDFGHRTGLRLKTYTPLGEILRSAQWFLDNNVSPKLMIRNDEFIQW